MSPTRREVLGWLSALPLAGLATVERTDEATRYVLNECFVAGFRFHAGPSLLSAMTEGARLELVAEPMNPHDEHAVRLEFDGHHVGYVPRNQNRPVARLLEQGAPVQCAVARIDPDAPTWERVTIQVSITLPT